MRRVKQIVLLWSLCVLSAVQAFAQAPAGAGPAPAEAPLRLAIAGVVHGHVHGFMRRLQTHQNVQVIAVAEPDPALRQAFVTRYKIAESMAFADVPSMLAAAKPEAVAAFTNTYDHAAVVAAAAARGVHVMMEKPLAVDMEQARAIQRAAESGHIHVIVNYETTWYASHGALWSLIKTQHAAGDIRKVVVMDGHEGPKEIGVQPEFLNWLTDPVKNGAGALFDFGCYGANLMTWLMDNQRPLSVTAVTQQIKPQIYAKVDDEATIVLEYPKAQAILQASWNWPFSRKDMEVYGATGYALAIGGNELRVRLPGQKEATTRKPEPLPADIRDEFAYLTAIVRGREKPSGLSSLENNVIVTEILSAARESARTGKTVKLSALK
jgi:predicted dehydrogenase